ncbi:uncharacterized protein [Taeniopygia guttata]|uniref:uncharacterized protein isoform X2 n=1 Tax=Taeniopygia guttata TaxID=59729 RepID=UPI003BB887BB
MAADPRPPHVLRGMLGPGCGGTGARSAVRRSDRGCSRRCAVSDGLRWDRDWDPGPGIWVPVPPVSAVGAGQSRSFLGGRGGGAGAGGSRRDRGWDRDRYRRGREEPLRLRPVRGWRSPEPPKGRERLRSLAPQGGSCRARPVARSVPNARPGTGTAAPDSAGTDTAEGLPVAPRPGAAPHRHAGMLQPGQTAPTAQRDPRERLASPGNGGAAICRGALTAIPVSDLHELPHSCQILNAKP